MEKFCVEVSIFDTVDFSSNWPELFFREEEVIQLASKSNVFEIVFSAVWLSLEGEEIFLKVLDSSR